MIEITFPDGKKGKYQKGTTALDIAKSISEGLARAVCAAKVNNVLVDATRPIEENATLQLLKFEDPEGRDVFWHSSTHLLAHAVLSCFPEAKPTIGPVIEEGYYYDFDHPPFSTEDLAKIEAAMKKLSDEKLDVKRLEFTPKEAVKQFKDNKYKVEIIKESPDKVITAYQQGDFTDLCRGPHLPNTGMIKAFKITKCSAAYWRGDAKNKSLQRIYGISFPDKKFLKAYEERIKEAELRDHKKIGKEQELFMVSEMIGKGLPVWLPRGQLIKGEIERFAIEMEAKAGFQRVCTPHLAKEELFLTSGHLPHYKEGMYPCMNMDDGTYYLKSMNCPMHHMIFKHRTRSYRELPLRLAEYGTVYRNELSGTLSGLLRVRMLSMNDAHIYCTKEQIGPEVKAVLEMIKEYYEVFGFNDYHFRLSKWDPKNKEKYISEPKNWEYAEEELRKVLKAMKVPFVEVENEAAFYGPKIDIQFKTVLGREESMSTVQLDFAAKKRFALEYTDKENKSNPDVFVVHRAPLSTHERFMAFLIEHYTGKWPLWLSPVQAIILTVADRHNAYAEKVAKQLRAAGIRTEVDTNQETIPKKVRNAQLAQINYILVVGDTESEHGTVNVRTRDNVVHGEKKTDVVATALSQEATSRALQGKTF